MQLDECFSYLLHYGLRAECCPWRWGQCGRQSELLHGHIHSCLGYIFHFDDEMLLFSYHGN